jgi:hypothetical protein
MKTAVLYLIFFVCAFLIGGAFDLGNVFLETLIGAVIVLSLGALSMVLKWASS